MDTSIFLARVIGLFGLLTTIAIVSRYKWSMEVEQQAAKNQVITYLSGFVMLLLGVLLVVSHSVWVWDWRVLITIIAWLMLLKGALRVFFPDTLIKMMEKKQRNRQFIWGEFVVMAVSVYLLYQGYFASYGAS